MIEPIESQINSLVKGFVTSPGGDGDDGPGASVLVVQSGETLFSRSYGLADVEAKIPCTPQTNFRLASVSKQFTAMAVLMLTERGRLTLDQRLTDFFPDFPGYGREITVHHLLVHSSGLPDYEDFVPADRATQIRDADVLVLLQRQRVGLFAPGSRFAYSNSAYCLLALIVERLSRQTFAAFLAEHLFAPLGMTGTVAFEDGVSPVPNRAYGYSPTETGFVRTDQSITSATLGDGGIYSSITDYARWDAALYTETLVRQDTLAQIFTPHQPLGEPNRFYGYGWFLYNDYAPPRQEHDGTTTGFRNYVIRVPAKRLTVLVLMNRNDGAARTLAEQIVDLQGV